MYKTDSLASQYWVAFLIDLKDEEHEEKQKQKHMCIWK